MRSIKGNSFTKEQDCIVDTVTIEKESVVVNAYAGASKSVSSGTTAKEFNGIVQYTVFGNSNTKSWGKDYANGRNILCNSNYSLAHRAIGYKYRQQGKLAETVKHILTRIIDAIGHKLKTQDCGGYIIDKNMQAYDIFRMINQFCYSVDDEIGIQHGKAEFIYPEGEGFTKTRLEEAYFSYLVPRAKYIWGLMVDLKSDFPVSHDLYMKLWGLSRPTINCDLLIADEAQDKNPVIVKVINDQQCQKLILGDQYQQLFSWKGSVNAMNSFDIDKGLQLSKSFRFGKQIGDIAHDIIEFQLEESIDIEGFEKIDTKVWTSPRDFKTKTILCRTNGECVKHLIDNFSRGKVKIIGDMANTIKMIKGILALRAKKSNPKKVVYGPLSIFKNYKELVEYSLTQAGSEIKTIIGVMNKAQKMNIDAIKLCDILAQSAKIRNPDVTICTGHRSKGLEFDNVILGDSFRRPTDEGWNHEDANLLYVAATRAKKNLDISGCAAILECIEEPFEHLLEKKK